MYAHGGRPSIAPEKLLRALLLQLLYTVRSERQLMEQLDYNLLFRWFVGLSMDDPVQDVSVFTKNRERLLGTEIARSFFRQVVIQARAHVLRDEHGRRLFCGGADKFQNDRHWRDYLLFYEYFHGDNGAGIGACHQRGWTAMVAKLIQIFSLLDAKTVLEAGKNAAFVHLQEAS